MTGALCMGWCRHAACTPPMWHGMQCNKPGAPPRMAHKAVGTPLVRAHQPSRCCPSRASSMCNVCAQIELEGKSACVCV